MEAVRTGFASWSPLFAGEYIKELFSGWMLVGWIALIALIGVLLYLRSQKEDDD